MNKRYYSLLVVLLILSISIILSCSNSTGPEDDHEFPPAGDSVATNITLYVNSGNFIIINVDTLEMATEGEIVIDIAGEGSCQIYAIADGFYSELYGCSIGETITVDLDPVPQEPNSVTGVIFYSMGAMTDQYYAEKNIVLTIPGGGSINGTTDSLGRYGFSNLSECEYILHSADFGIPKSFSIINTAGTDYKELFNVSEITILAPNIYLYPETTTDISVDISFPNGGHIVESDPPYINGWNVSVTPDGIIDGEYNYLFYDTKQPAQLNILSGWLLDGTKLESELRFIMMNLGYVGREVDDFVEYWIPKIGPTPYLAMHPQDVESQITLTIEPVPDNLLRMLFLFRPLDEPIELEELPLPDAIQRNGFTAIEWGGILIDE
ncbi:MAG: hypothetical protein GY865_04240 [candidate division Zixibacteria bacterium]|nr:hypothetical protein [candidate division Zixibacteria bacterium]